MASPPRQYPAPPVPVWAGSWCAMVSAVPRRARCDAGWCAYDDPDGRRAAAGRRQLVADLTRPAPTTEELDGWDGSVDGRCNCGECRTERLWFPEPLSASEAQCAAAHIPDYAAVFYLLRKADLDGWDPCSQCGGPAPVLVDARESIPGELTLGLCPTTVTLIRCGAS